MIAKKKEDPDRKVLAGMHAEDAREVRAFAEPANATVRGGTPEKFLELPEARIERPPTMIVTFLRAISFMYEGTVYDVIKERVGKPYEVPWHMGQFLLKNYSTEALAQLPVGQRKNFEPSVEVRP